VDKQDLLTVQRDMRNSIYFC